MTQGILNRFTVFADIESGAPWSQDALVCNQHVINGFLERIAGVFGTVGVYSGPCEWSQITGSVGWAPKASPVIWTSEYSYESDPGCAAIEKGWGYYYNAPCPSSYVGARGFASRIPTIWQYTENGSGKGYDWDVAYPTLPS